MFRKIIQQYFTICNPQRNAGCLVKLEQSKHEYGKFKVQSNNMQLKPKSTQCQIIHPLESEQLIPNVARNVSCLARLCLANLGLKPHSIIPRLPPGLIVLFFFTFTMKFFLFG